MVIKNLIENNVVRINSTNRLGKGSFDFEVTFDNFLFTTSFSI